MSNRFLRRLVVALIVAATGGGSYQAYLDGVPIGETIDGIVLHVVDGDTMRLNGIKIRLWGVNAPETDAYGGDRATDELQEQALLKKLSCVIRDRDKYGRIVAQCFRNKQDIGAAIIRSGWARDYPRYSKGYYLKDEATARYEHRGLWGRKS